MSEYKMPDIQGWMSGEELDWLFDQAAVMTSIIEVGCWRGRTTYVLCSGCKGNVISVDHFMGSSDERDTTHAEAKTIDISQDWWRNVGHFKNLSLMKMESKMAASFFREKSVDMIFIDGCHQYSDVKADLEAWIPICKRLICGHDIGYNGVSRAIDETGLNVIRGPATIWSIEL